MKLDLHYLAIIYAASPPTRGRGLKRTSGTQINYSAGRPPRGGVDVFPTNVGMNRDLPISTFFPNLQEFFNPVYTVV